MEPPHPSSATVLAPEWPLEDGADVREELLAAYGGPERGYHDRTHLAEVLGRLEELSAGGADFDRVPVLLAAWFHDAVYDGERDAEERSAAWAEEVLPQLAGSGTTEEVARLVRLTETHRPEADDVNGHALSDADLGILAADPARYAEYTADVRREYAHLDDATFAAGRAHVLADLLDKPRLFHSRYALERWEDAARANASAELEQLRAAVPVTK